MTWVTGIIKTDITDHQPNFIICNDSLDTPDSTLTTTYKRTINDKTIRTFRHFLTIANWELVTDCNDVNSSYDTFLEIFSRCYNKAFPKHEVSIKSKTIKMGLKRSLKIFKTKAKIIRKISEKQDLYK